MTKLKIWFQKLSKTSVVCVKFCQVWAFILLVQPVKGKFYYQPRQWIPKDDRNMLHKSVIMDLSGGGKKFVFKCKKKKKDNI